jgi:hypothetical protein
VHASSSSSSSSSSSAAAAAASGVQTTLRVLTEEAVSVLSACSLAVLLQAAAQILWARPSARPVAASDDKGTLDVVVSLCLAVGSMHTSASWPERLSAGAWPDMTARQAARLAHAVSIAAACRAVRAAGEHTTADRAEAVANSDLEELITALDVLASA